MIMSKEQFQTKIGSGKTVVYGRYSFQKCGGDYYFGGESTEIFKTWEEFWDCCGSFILYGVDYSDKSKNRKMNNSSAGGPSALAYDSKKFNSTGKYGEGIIPKYYDRKDELVIWYR